MARNARVNTETVGTIALFPKSIAIMNCEGDFGTLFFQNPLPALKQKNKGFSEYSLFSNFKLVFSSK